MKVLSFFYNNIFQHKVLMAKFCSASTAYATFCPVFSLSSRRDLWSSSTRMQRVCQKAGRCVTDYICSLSVENVLQGWLIEIISPEWRCGFWRILGMKEKLCVTTSGSEFASCFSLAGLKWYWFLLKMWLPCTALTWECWRLVKEWWSTWGWRVPSPLIRFSTLPKVCCSSQRRR